MADQSDIEERLRQVTPEECQDMWRRSFDLWARGNTFEEAWEQVISPRLIVEAVSNSSNVLSYEYDVQSHILVIEFSGGAKYAYSDVAPETWHSRVEWDSQGKWTNEVIKKAHAYERIES